MFEPNTAFTQFVHEAVTSWGEVFYGHAEFAAGIEDLWGPGSNGAKNNEVRVAPGPGRRTSRCWWPLSVAAVGTEEAGDAAHGRR